MSQLPHLPIQPTSATLSAHLAAFDQLIAQLGSLPSRTRWQAQLPINSKTRVSGSVVHTNDVKVCLGAGWWVEMTAREAVEYIGRKKLALLEHHLRQKEGIAPSTSTSDATLESAAPWPLPPAISFNPLFRHPLGAQEEPAVVTEIENPPSTSTAESLSKVASSGRHPSEGREMEQGSGAVTLEKSGEEEISSQVTMVKPPSTASSAAKPAPSGSPTIPALAKQPHAPKRSSPLNPNTPPSEPSTSTSAITEAVASSTSASASTSSATTTSQPSAANAQTAEALADLLRKLVDSDKLDLAGAKEDKEPLVNEDGLPIHEIRETPEGKSLDEGITSTAAASGGSAEETEQEERDRLYWSADAVARRKALLAKVFEGGDSDVSSENEESEEDADLEAEPRPDSKGKGRQRARRSVRHDDSGESSDEGGGAEFPLAIGARRTSSPPPIPSVDLTAPTPVTPTAVSLAGPSASQPTHPEANVGNGRPSSLSTTNDNETPTSPVRRSSATMPPPAKSILKTAPRKKSVSFDDSVPIPPDSPERGGPGPKGKMGFQLPLPIAVGGEETDGFGGKAVPLISAPIPKSKAAESSPLTAGSAGGAFAGFKRGFLNGSAAPTKGKSAQTATAPTPAPEVKPGKKPSLFAQRLAQKAVVESPAASAPSTPVPPGQRAVSKPKPALPKMSESTGTSSIKPAVVEKPPAVRETVKKAAQPEVANWTPLSQLPRNAPSGFKPGESSGSQSRDAPASTGEQDDDDDDDFYEEMEFDSDEEDEYDLDDALLAREMALEYHRRKVFQAPRTYGSDEEDYADADGDPDKLDLGGTDAGGLGNVMLALPQVEGGDGPQIVNPTPDDWRRFVRVGRLENGNLVLAPGQEGWEEDEDADEGAADGAGWGGGEAGPLNSGHSTATAGSSSTTSDNRTRFDTGAPVVSVPTMSADEKKANVDRMKRVLLGLEQDQPVKVADVAQVVEQVRLPPTLQKAQPAVASPAMTASTPAATPASTEIEKSGATRGVGNIVERAPGVVGAVQELSVGAAEAKPKKVSKFKAARMGV